MILTIMYSIDDQSNRVTGEEHDEENLEYLLNCFHPMVATIKQTNTNKDNNKA